MSIFLISGFCFQSPGIVFKQKQRNPDRQTRKTFEWNNYEKWTYKLLRAHNYPWGVCFSKGNNSFKSKYNLIYPQFGSLPDNVLGMYDPIDPWFSDFHGRIIMSNKEEWEKPHFINVMMHELGHVLGLPHLKRSQTDIMTSHGFGCATEGEREICKLNNTDFKEFLKPYGPGKVRNWRKEQAERDDWEKARKRYRESCDYYHSQGLHCP